MYYKDDFNVTFEEESAFTSIWMMWKNGPNGSGHKARI